MKVNQAKRRVLVQALSAREHTSVAKYVLNALRELGTYSILAAEAPTLASHLADRFVLNPEWSSEALIALARQERITQFLPLHGVDSPLLNFNDSHLSASKLTERHHWLTELAINNFNVPKFWFAHSRADFSEFSQNQSIHLIPTRSQPPFGDPDFAYRSFSSASACLNYLEEKSRDATLFQKNKNFSGMGFGRYLCELRPQKNSFIRVQCCFSENNAHIYDAYEISLASPGDYFTPQMIQGPISLNSSHKAELERLLAQVQSSHKIACVPWIIDFIELDDDKKLQIHDFRPGLDSSWVWAAGAGKDSVLAQLLAQMGLGDSPKKIAKIHYFQRKLPKMPKGNVLEAIKAPADKESINAVIKIVRPPSLEPGTHLPLRPSLYNNPIQLWSSSISEQDVGRGMLQLESEVFIETKNFAPIDPTFKSDRITPRVGVLEFLDPMHKFKVLQGNAGAIYYFGNIDRPWIEVLELLERGIFPEKLRGNFAFAYIPWEWPEQQRGPRLMAAVDHIASMPMFHSDRYISFHYSAIAAAVARDAGSEIHQPGFFDIGFYWESHFFWGFNASERTAITEIRRVPLGCYFERWQATNRGAHHEYLNIFSLMEDRPLDLGEFRETLESVIQRGCGEENALLLSGGTDSSTLLAAISRMGLKKKFTYVTACSKAETFSELPLISEMERLHNIRVERFWAPTILFQVEPFLLDPPSNNFFWREYSFHYRRGATASIYHPGLKSVMTGESGDQVFGGPKPRKIIPMILQKRDWNWRDVARQYIHLCMREVFLEWQGYANSPLVDAYLEKSAEAGNIYEETCARLETMLERMPSKDLLNRLLALNLYLKGPYGLFHYSQEPYPYYHPYSSWEIVRLGLATRSQDKMGNGGRLKDHYFRAYQEGLVERAWRAPKIGTAIPFR